jgi:hypothetical protein
VIRSPVRSGPRPWHLRPASGDIDTSDEPSNSAVRLPDHERTGSGTVPRDHNAGTMGPMSGARLRVLPMVVITLAATLSACSTHPTSPLPATSSDRAACQAYDVQYRFHSGSVPPVEVPYLFQLLGKADNAALRADGKSMQSEVEKVYASDSSGPQRTQATAAFTAATRSVTSTCRAMGDAPTI